MQHVIAEAAPVLGHAFRRAKAAMHSNGVRDTALAELRRLDAVMQKIKEARVEHSRRFRAYCEKSEARFRDSPTIENEIASRLARIVCDDDDAHSPVSHHPALLGAVYDHEMQAV